MNRVCQRLAVAAGVLLLLATMVSVSVFAQGGELKIVPQEEAIVGLLRGLEMRVEPFSVDRGDWDESAGYTIPDERDMIQHTLVVYAVTLPSPVEARDFFIARARQLELDNEMTHAWNTPRAENLGADDSREFRIIYVDVASRSRSAEYARLIRRGPIVGLVEVVGSPSVDDEGGIDDGRHSILVGVSHLLMSRMAQQPVVPANQATLPGAPMVDLARGVS